MGSLQGAQNLNDCINEVRSLIVPVGSMLGFAREDEAWINRLTTLNPTYKADDRTGQQRTLQDQRSHCINEVGYV